ncbi:MAG: HEAT repeat domain-containing protein [Spirochaetes bacterium]|nr:HEAT repeat domain-containing protein [Spirochaetota bacterium]MBN2770817.1 HEAT repeat domain-containing protein [Spirochaetota bacterium]
MKYYLIVLLSVSLLYTSLYCQETGKKDTPVEKSSTETATDDKTEDKADIKKDESAAAKDKDVDISDKQRENDIKGAAYIRKTLKFGMQKERAIAIRNIDRIKTPSLKKELIDEVINNLDDEKNTSVIINTINLASREKRKDAASKLTPFLSHPENDVKIAAVYAIKDLEAKETAPELIKELKSQDFSVNSNFIEGLLVTLGAFEEKSLYDFAKKTIDDPDTTAFHRLRLILFLGDSKTSAAAPYLKEVFSNEDEDLSLRSYAVSALSRMDEKSAIADINKEIEKIDSFPFKKKQRYYNFYIYCVTSLVKLGDPKAYPRLEESLKSDNAAVRLQSIQLMKDLKDKRSIDILKYKAEYDQNSRVRNEAKKVLKEQFDVDLDKDKKSDKEKKEDSIVDDPGETMDTEEDAESE